MRKKKFVKFLAGVLAAVMLLAEPAAYAAEGGASVKTATVSEKSTYKPETDRDDAAAITAIAIVNNPTTVTYLYGKGSPSLSGASIKVTYSAGVSYTVTPGTTTWNNTGVTYALYRESDNSVALKDSKGYYPIGKYYWKISSADYRISCQIPVSVVNIYTYNLLSIGRSITIDPSSLEVYKYTADNTTVLAASEESGKSFEVTVYDSNGNEYASGESFTLPKGTYYIVTKNTSEKTEYVTYTKYDSLKDIRRVSTSDVSFKYGSFGYYVGETTVSGSSAKEMKTPLAKNTPINKIEKSFTSKPTTTVSGNSVSGNKTVSGNNTQNDYVFWFDESFKLVDNSGKTITTKFNSFIWNAFQIVQNIFNEDGTQAETDENGFVAIGEYVAKFTSGKATLEIPFSVTESATVKDIRKASVSGVTDMKYDGSPLKPDPTVKINGVTLTKGTDYTVSYVDNIRVGTASILIKGKGKYSGTLIKNFEIIAAKKYSVTFKGNGATSGTMKTLTNVGIGEEIILPKNNFVRNGYKFTGWNGKADGSAKSFKDRQTVMNLARKNGTNIKLYAQWEKQTYSISYVLNGGTNSSSNPKYYDVETATITLASASKANYKFAGWYTDSSFTEKVTSIPKGSYGNIKLYAKFESASYNVKFDGNGATSGKLSTLKSRKVGKVYTLPKNKFEKIGYKFVGWNTKKDGTGTTVKDAGKYKNLTETNGKTVTLYAQWEPVEYTITYVLKKGKNNAANPDKYFVTSNDITLKNPKRSGYKFAGWYTDSACTEKITKIEKGSIGNVVLYAKWKKR